MEHRNIIVEKIECDYCGLSTNNSLSYKCHIKSCNIIKDNIDTVIESYKNGTSIKKIINEYKVSYKLLLRVFSKYDIKVRNLSESLIGKTKIVHTEETKRKISVARKNYFKNNPDKHNWKSNEKFVSNPCENFKMILDELGINYISEFTPLEDRFFSIDIALPEKRIGIEINGNQHYESDGTLKKYYNDRHNLIESSGWKLYELHYSICYNKDVVLNVINNIEENNKDIFDFDYDRYLIDKIEKNSEKFVCDYCGGEKRNKYSKMCLNCSGLKSRKNDRPTYNQLLLDVEKLGYTGSGKKYGVSDNSIRKWIKKYEEDK